LALLLRATAAFSGRHDFIPPRLPGASVHEKYRQTKGLQPRDNPGPKQERPPKSPLSSQTGPPLPGERRCGAEASSAQPRQMFYHRHMRPFIPPPSPRKRELRGREGFASCSELAAAPGATPGLRCCFGVLQAAGDGGLPPLPAGPRGIPAAGDHRDRLKQNTAAKKAMPAFLSLV